MAAHTHSWSCIQERKECFKRLRSGDFRVLVCTDAGSRGLDIPQVIPPPPSYCVFCQPGPCRHFECACVQMEYVINFDFPLSVLDYLHRAGRTGRVGSRQGCQVVSLMTHRRDVRMAHSLKASELDTYACAWVTLSHLRFCRMLRNPS